jgi:hypothetical protein
MIGYEIPIAIMVGIAVAGAIFAYYATKDKKAKHP